MITLTIKKRIYPLKIGFMKSLLYLTSILTISIVGIFVQSELSVNFNLPEKIKAGESFILDIEIDKGEISNFSKLQLNLPQGFSAELVDGKNGTFTFYDQKIKLIWISLPEVPKFKVHIKINVDSDKVGQFNFDGKISYVIGGTRKEKPLTTPKFDIQAYSKPSQITKLDNNKSEISTNNLKDLTCTRNLSSTDISPGETFKVELTVQKNGITGLGKIIENLPQGFIATEIESNGAIFSTKENQVKFLWMTLPTEEKFIVSYKVKLDDNTTGSKVINGKMSYLEGDETKTVLITEKPVITNNQMAKNELNQNTDQTVQNETIQNTDQTAQNETIQNTDQTVKSKNSPINYRVQICATKKKVNTNYFVKNHKINQQIYANTHEGWHKYTIGEFPIYKSARNQREIIKNNHKIIGPFVTAYNNGTRITVQEALMISKDEWVQ